jgi:predicted GNAT family acetyltransferase
LSFKNKLAKMWWPYCGVLITVLMGKNTDWDFVIVPIKTYTEQLEETQSAITAIMTGSQEYSIKDRRMRRAELRDLQAREVYLRPLASREASGGNGCMVIRGGTPT